MLYMYFIRENGIFRANFGPFHRFKGTILQINITTKALYFNRIALKILRILNGLRQFIAFIPLNKKLSYF
ncbi:hypothetical protein AC623_16760 [Bacillus sp. FJAT-27231]|nr:hypothetical protein AC623_16760 [Bacillus sp. FJAT-27231]